MNRKFVVSLLCLTVISCTLQQETNKPITATTFESDIMPNKFSVTSAGRIDFHNWQISFLLPQDWDVNRYEFGMDSGYKIEAYYFYGPEYSIRDSRKTYPILAFLFHPIADDVEMSAYLESLKNWTDDPEFKFIKSYSPQEIGHNLNSAIAYKCQYQESEIKNINCYVIRAVYDKKGVEIHMLSDTNMFEQVDVRFLELINSISFAQ